MGATGCFYFESGGPEVSGFTLACCSKQVQNKLRISAQIQVMGSFFLNV